MNGMQIVSWVLIILGAVINFLVPVLLKKGKEVTEEVMKKIYVVKSIGLILVVIGCVIIFWLGGKFGG